MTTTVLDQEMFSEAEAARLLPVPQSTLHWWLDGGQLPEIMILVPGADSYVLPGSEAARSPHANLGSQLDNRQWISPILESPGSHA